eukprot:scaffold1062_cov130-Cylindrotheca_fusiformis.AAC.18
MNDVAPTEKVYAKGTRLFLSEVNQDLGAEKLSRELEALFGKYGNVREVFVPTRTTKAYAFVRLESSEEARHALSISTPNALFKRIKPAKDVAPRNKKRDRLKQTALEDLWERKELSSSSNVICQVHQSHFERLTTFLRQEAESLDFSVVGVMPKTSSRTVSFIFVFAPDRPEFCAWVQSLWFVRSNVHRLFLVDGAPVEGGLETNVSPSICEAISKLDEASIRLQVFPPQLSSQLLDLLETQLDDLATPGSVVLTPKTSTHVLGVVRLVEAVSEAHHGLYVIGLWESMSTPLPSPPLKPVNSFDSSICRAYWKLQEAFERYRFELPEASTSLTSLDCGASPGGWTQFLERNLRCQKIYSIDPGVLHSSVLDLDNVIHMQLTIQKALPKLREEDAKIDVWVSDMCVKDMEQQVDWLLKAQEMGVLGPGAFFVLTLKCILGHSTKTFDSLVEQQVTRLQPLARDLHTMHLFSNRYSERTILGYFTKNIRSKKHLLLSGIEYKLQQRKSHRARSDNVPYGR